MAISHSLLCLALVGLATAAPAPAASGPLAAGPTSSPPGSISPAKAPDALSPAAYQSGASAPTASGPTASGPTASGPTASGPTASGPSVPGPTASGPTAGPVPPPSGCLASHGSTVFFYQRCQALDDKFSLQWNASAEGPGGNVTLTLHLTGPQYGYLAFGVSPGGGMMVNSSAIAGFESADGTPSVAPYFLAAKKSANVTRGGALQLESGEFVFSSKVTYNMSSGNSTLSSDRFNQNSLRANVSVPAATASQSLSVIWAGGQAGVNNTLVQHLVRGSGTLVPLCAEGASCPASSIPQDASKGAGAGARGRALPALLALPACALPLLLLL